MLDELKNKSVAYRPEESQLNFLQVKVELANIINIKSIKNIYAYYVNTIAISLRNR